jgi:NB-ARC domain
MKRRSATGTGSRPLSKKRFIVSSVLGVLVAVLGAAPDLLNDPRFGWRALAAFAVLTIAVTFLATDFLNRFRPAADPIAVNTGRARTLLFNSARPVPRQRQAQALSEFRGRGLELNHWVNEHTRLRRTRDGGVRVLSPVVLAMHGPPGVGKSMLTQALARRLQEGYRDGYLVASFGASGTARGPADIARDLLLQLGWPETDMPSDTEDRVATLRSLTRHKAMLFLFDAVRDHDQVRQLMPAEPRCAVILSSRREIGSSLGLAPRPPIAATTMSDSLAMLSAISNVDWTRDAATTVEIVELCGRLPLAIRSVSERIRDGEGTRYVAALLRPPRGRLTGLDYGGRSIRERIRSEFERLTRPQREALRLLSTIDSDTFVPWVLRPLLNLGHRESTTVVAGLAAAQFVEEVGRDGTGQTRYRLYPLMRLYARQDPTAIDTAAAGQRFDDAYIDLIDDVFAETDRDYRLIRKTEERHSRTVHSTIATRLAPTVDNIVPYEYLNLVRIIHAADLGTHAAMIWRIAALLDGRVPSLSEQSSPIEASTARIDAAFELGVRAARKCDTIAGEINVRLGRAQFLLAIERYGAADEELRVTARRLEETEATPATGGPDRDQRLQLRLYRVSAWAHVQRGAYSEAYQVLSQADELIDSLPEGAQADPYVRTDMDLIRLFNDEAHRVSESRTWTRRPVHLRPGGTVELRTALGRTEALRRQGNWADATDDLRQLLDQFVDARSRTSILYRLAQLLNDEARHLKPAKQEASHRDRLVREAIQHAAACIVAFASIGDSHGQVRARCLLMRTLVLAGNQVAAMQLALEVAAELTALADDPSTTTFVPPLRGRYERARAEVEIANNRSGSAWDYLTRAAHVFQTLGDWSSHNDTWRILDQLYSEGRGIPDNPVGRP